MDNQALQRYISKLNEDIRNIKYQINSILQDIQKDKKQSYIEKRIDRLIDKYKKIYEKYQAISGLDKKEVVEMQGILINVAEKVELVCKIGSKDVNKQNTKLDMWSKEDVDENLVYVSDITNDEVVNVYDKDGQLELVYIHHNGREGFLEKVKNRREERAKFRKEGLIKRRFSFNKKKNSKNKLGNKILKRAASFGMALLMLLPVSNATSQQDTKNESENGKGSYTDNMKKTPVSSHPLIEAVDKTEEIVPSVETKSEKETQSEKDTKLEEKIHIIAPAQCKYTEVSDGSGEYGIFSEETEVAIYNRALIRSNKDGSKSILKATKIGQTWEEYAEEQGLDYNEFKEYIENNDNIQEVISTMSVDGKNIYGWILASNLEYRTESKNIEVERSYVTELEER